MALNDYFATTYHSLTSDNGIRSFMNLLSAYREHSVKRLFLASDFHPNISVAMHVDKIRRLKELVRPLSNSNPRIELISVIPLIKGISNYKDISKLSYFSGNSHYIFIHIPLARDTDTIISELHNIVHKLKLIPVITSFERTVLYLPKRTVESLFRLPRAIYQVNNKSLHSSHTLKLVQDLHRNNKTVIFGSGSEFDACLYSNINYYIKLIEQSVGSSAIGYFMLRHNRVFL